MEWAGWFLTLPLTGWLIKEVWSNISQTRFMRKQAANEHQYFKKRLIFEQKHEVYKELYQKLKHMVGVSNSLTKRETLTTSAQEAVNNYVFYHLNDDDNFETDEFVKKYNENPLNRVKANHEYYLILFGDKKREFNNFVSEQNYILTYEENVITKNIKTKADEIEQYISQTKEIVLIEDPAERLRKLELRFLDETYQKLFSELNDLTLEFSDTIRKEMFL